MTQPDGFFPEDAANYGSFAAYAAKTQQDYEDERYNTEVARWAPVGSVRNDLKSTWDALFKGWWGDGGSGFSIHDVFDTAVAQKREQADLAAGLAQLQADVTANNNSGSTFQLDVSNHSGVPSVLTEMYRLGSGTVTNDGDTLELSNDDLLVAWKYNGGALETDWFETSLIVPRQARRYFNSYGERSLLFIGRATSDFDQLCMARLNGDEVSVGYVDGGLDEGTYTWFGSGATGTGPTTVTITPGSYMTFRGGTVAGVRIFQFLVNNQAKATFVDDDDVSEVGELHRHCGFGIWNDTDDLINRVPNVSHFVANDNAPAPTMGTYAAVYRDATTPTSSGGTGDQIFVAGTFDTEERISSDIHFTDGNRFTVDKAGPYLFTVQANNANVLVSEQTCQFLLYKRGLLHRRGPQWRWDSTSWRTFSHTFPVYLDAGDWVQPGHNFPANPVWDGDAAGTLTYMSLVYKG